MAWEAGYRDVGWNMSFPNYPLLPGILVLSRPCSVVLLLRGVALSKLSNLPAVFSWPAFIGWLLVPYQLDDSHSVEEDE